MKDLIEELYLTNRAFVTDDYQACLDYIDANELPLDYHEFQSGHEVWDSWVVPQKWTVNHAYIEADGERILSFDDHPLHLIAYSDSFEGRISREQLVDHVHTDSDDPDAIPWHYTLNYRPWKSEWGFCASQRFVESLDRDEYYVSIDTTFEDDVMTVAEHHLPGASEDTIVVMAHLDHTGMANDDLSGVAAGVELLQRLRDREDRTYSYKLLLVQERLGSAAYLERFAEEVENFVCGVFLEMLGNDNRLVLQRTFTGDTKLDAVAEHVFEVEVDSGAVGEFLSYIGNDELMLEAPGYEIPTISVNRFPYPEYHTHFDDPTIISEEQLEDAVTSVETIIDILENDFVPIREFSGIPSLANPKYDLYLTSEAVDDDVGRDEAIGEFRTRVFRTLDGDLSAFDIARQFGLEFEFVRSYLREFEEKGLIRTERPAFDA